jgi:hypothetical protein
LVTFSLPVIDVFLTALFFILCDFKKMPLMPNSPNLFGTKVGQLLTPMKQDDIFQTDDDYCSNTNIIIYICIIIIYYYIIKKI